MSNRRKTINLLEPINPPSDTWTAIYNWVVKIGRYLMLTVEVIVLLVFFSRFIFDRQNNDLTDSINDKMSILTNEEFRSEEIQYRNLQTLLSDVAQVKKDQQINSNTIASIISGVPGSLLLDKYTFDSNRITMTVVGSSLQSIKDYEFSLKQNPEYSNVSVSINRSGISTADYVVNVSFLVKPKSNT